MHRSDRALATISQALPLAALAVWGASASASSVDLRACRLTSLTFHNAAGTHSFRVTEFGQERFFACNDTNARSATDRGNCRGPFGRQVLKGEFADSTTGSSRPVFAQYWTLLALPCCGWEVSEEIDFDDTGVEWLPREEIPRLGTQPYVSIKGIKESSAFADEMFPLECNGDP
ncbi:hypothetical protein ATO6_02030 [Oceanicola sp. 22II-s10i]|nr:hypothetical protein ATO6_02030 [Oceanicola sp. 22II-s10i]